jgi:hypothetical protein
LLQVASLETSGYTLVLLLGLLTFPTREGPDTLMVCTPSHRSADNTTDKEKYIFLEARTHGFSQGL